MLLHMGRLSLSLPRTNTNPVLLFLLLTSASVERIQEMFHILSENPGQSLCVRHTPITVLGIYEHRDRPVYYEEQSIQSK